MIRGTAVVQGHTLQVCRFPNAVDGGSDVKIELSADLGRPVETRKIASQVTASTGLFPSAGSGLAQSGSPNTLRLPVDAPLNVDYKNLLCLLRGGNGGIQARRIVSLNAGNGDLTLERNWAAGLSGWTGPVAGDPFDILVDTFCGRFVYWKTEYQDDDTVIAARLIAYTATLVPGDEFKLERTPDTLVDRALETIGNTKLILTPSEASYRHGETLKQETMGALGVKLYVAEKQGTGAYSLWGGGA